MRKKFCPRGICSQRDSRVTPTICCQPSGAHVGAISPDVANSALRRAAALAQSDPDAALLLDWAAIEALGRVLEPNLTEFSLDPLALVDLLVGYGHLAQEDGKTLRALALKRNRIAHCAFGDDALASDIAVLTSLADSLVGALAQRRRDVVATGATAH